MIPLDKYLFRYNRGGFWVGVSAFKYWSFPFNRLTRWFLNDFLHTRMLYRALHASGRSTQYMVQDLALPYATAKQFVDYTAEEFKIWPLWLRPLRQSPLPTMYPHVAKTEADGKTPKPMLNVGLWGQGPAKQDVFAEANGQLEHKLQELGGMKWLYAKTYYTEKEFWSIYDRKWYDALRQKYHATSLPSVFDKVKLDVEAEKGKLNGSWKWWDLGNSEEYKERRLPPGKK
jgi:delta24-sterol reductase